MASPIFSLKQMRQSFLSLLCLDVDLNRDFLSELELNSLRGFKGFVRAEDTCVDICWMDRWIYGWIDG